MILNIGKHHREGSEKDVNALKEMFTELKFDVEIDEVCKMLILHNYNADAHGT